jgi:hypothetical protein
MSEFNEEVFYVVFSSKIFYRFDNRFDQAKFRIKSKKLGPIFNESLIQKPFIQVDN